MTFFLHATNGKQDKQQRYPIKAQLDVNGKRGQVTLPKLRTTPENWCNDTKRTKPAEPQNAYINLLLDRVQARFEEAKTKGEKDKTAYTWADMHKIILAKETPKLSFEDMVSKFLKHYKDLKAPSTHKLHKWKISIWQPYFLEVEKIQHISQIKKAMQHGLYVHALQTTTCEHNSAALVLIGVQTFLNYAIEEEWITHNPFNKIKYKIENKPKVYLSVAEVENIRTLDLQDKPHLEIARDFFLISCATGLAYQELKNLSKEQIVSLERDYLRIKRQKTKTVGHIPILEEASALLIKYDYSFSLHYATYREQVKKLGVLAHIEKNMSTHTGRKTFANFMLNEHDVPLEVVSNMMCHTDIKTTAKYYADVQLEKIRKNTAHIK